MQQKQEGESKHLCVCILDKARNCLLANSKFKIDTAAKTNDKERKKAQLVKGNRVEEKKRKSSRK